MEKLFKKYISNIVYTYIHIVGINVVPCLSIFVRVLREFNSTVII